MGFPSSVDLPDPGIKPGSPALQADSLPTELSEPVSTPILSMRPQGLEKVKLSVPCHPLREELELKHRRACMYAKSFQSCPTLCDLMNYSPPGSSVHGILQARILKWVAVSEPLRKSPAQMSDPISSLCLYFHPPPSRNHLSELRHWSIPRMAAPSGFSGPHFEVHEEANSGASALRATCARHEAGAFSPCRGRLVEARLRLSRAYVTFGQKTS